MHFCFVVLAIALPISAFATSTSGISYQGRILKPDGQPLEGANVQFRFQLRTPDSSDCLMYEEQQAIDMRDSKGSFALTLNDGSGVRMDSTGIGLDKIFANRGSFTFNSTTCSAGSTYTPNENDGRRLIVYFKDETMSAWEPMPAQSINYVPYAYEAKQIVGYGVSNLLRFSESDGTLVNTSPLNNAQYAALLALVNGTSSVYEKSGSLGGVSLPTLGVGQAGQVLSWNGTAWEMSASTAQWSNGSSGAISYSGGNVGIGVTAPTSRLEVDGTITAAAGTTTTPSLTFSGATTTGLSSSDGSLQMLVGGGLKLSIGTSGVWGNAQRSPYIPLTTAGSAAAPTYAFLGDADTGMYSETTDYLRFSTSGSHRMTIDSAGNVGVGTTAPSYKLDVSGDLRITGTPYRDGGDVAWTVPSDARLKDITANYERGLREIASLETIKFRYKAGNAKGLSSVQEYTGVIAQEVQKQIPEAVKEDKDGFLSLNTTPIFWAMINAIKDLYAADKAKDQRIEALEKENSEMKVRLEKIEGMLGAN